MNKSALGMGLIIILLLIAGCSNGANIQSNVVANPASTTGEVREFTMIAKQWDFNPGTITVNQGDKVRLVIDSLDVAHGFTLSEFEINARLQPGKTTTVEFVADKKGTYLFFCSVQCGIGHSNMRGKLVVN